MGWRGGRGKGGGGRQSGGREWGEEKGGRHGVDERANSRAATSGEKKGMVERNVVSKEPGRISNDGHHICMRNGKRAVSLF